MSKVAKGARHTIHVGNPAESAHAALGRRWLELCKSFLPVVPDDSIWRYSRAPTMRDPEQGWKLHISATILTANETFKRVAPFLRGRGLLFKAPGTLSELERINSGLHHGYSQVGKFITVYPHSTEESRYLARRLHELTRRLPAPAVPFDLRFNPGSNVYYRYGSFIPLEIREADGTTTPAIRNLEGELEPDLRESARASPAWVREPLFVRRPRPGARQPAGPLLKTYRVFRALTQRGKGGVYQAIDLSTPRPRLCLLKEGRRNGEPVWDGRDGRWRVRHEERALALLRERGVDVPRIYASFESGGNYYLVTEFIEGESLQKILRRLRRRMPVAQALQHGMRLASLIAQIHTAGWVWRDCKPSNLMVTKGGTLRPLDFEGACPLDSPDLEPWGTPEFTPPQMYGADAAEAYGVSHDLYALGSVIYLLLAGLTPGPAPTPVEKLRRNVPPEASQLIGKLLSPNPRHRPGPEAVVRRLSTLPGLAISNSKERSGGRREV